MWGLVASAGCRHSVVLSSVCDFTLGDSLTFSISGSVGTLVAL